MCVSLSSLTGFNPLLMTNRDISFQDDKRYRNKNPTFINQRGSQQFQSRVLKGAEGEAFGDGGEFFTAS
jgi:hypothetical protein